MSDGYSTANYMAVPDGMMRIKLKASIVVAGFSDKRPGDVFDAPARLAFHLVVNRWAEEVVEAPVPVPVAFPETIETREPVVVNRDPEVAVLPQTPPGKSLPRKPAK